MAERISLERDAEAPARARSAITRWLGKSLDRESLEDVKLLVSELVTNAVRHPVADGRVEMRLEVKRGHVRVEVSDPGAGFSRPRVGQPPPDSPGGRGLLIVDRVASRWGVASGRPTCVWFELDR